MQDFHAIIIGAGIAGLSNAYWLGQVGWRVTVLEYQSAIAPGGYPILISGAGLDTLKRMNLKDLPTIPYRQSNSVIRDGRGREILSLRFADIHGTVPIVSVCKGDLARAIAAALPGNVTIRFDARIDALQDHPDKQAEVELEGGEVIEGDFIFGADGILSDVRGHYWEDDKWAELLGCWYATYDVSMDHGLEDYAQSYSGSGHIDVLTAPAKDRVSALHLWRDDHIKPLGPNDMKYDVLRRVTSKKNKKVWEVLHAGEKAVIVPILNRAFMVTLDEWRRCRVILVGDAAHCLGPWSSQGAGISMASAEALAQEIVACAKGSSSLSVALGRWERRVRPVVEGLQMRVRASAPKLLPKNKPVYAVRMLVTRALGEEAAGEWQALGVRKEVELATLPPVAPVLPSERRVVEDQGAGSKVGEEGKVGENPDEQEKVEQTGTETEKKEEDGGKVDETEPATKRE